MFNIFKKEPNLPIYFYNTLSREKEVFSSIKKGKVGLYTCGPTVYNYAHIGNLRAYIFDDILAKTLRYNGYKVRHVMNITDVGHLTGDRDMGEDKLEKKAKSEGQDIWKIAEKYTDAFFADEKLLNITEPNIVCKATDNIKEQIKLIKKLEKNGFTYKTSDGIYFDTSKVNDYNKLSHQNIEALREGARIEINSEKKNLTDFALWKFSPKDEKRQMEWPSPWGVGFPGWHIECSAMSMKYLGEQFDIHCGGIDHIDIHHTNEIAQSESATGKKPWVKYWMHNAFLIVDGGKKMAKSEGSFLTLTNSFIEKGVNPLAYRFANLGVHYRKQMEWSDDVLISAENGLNNLYTRIKNLGGKKGKVIQEWKNKFNTAINDDLNTPQAMAILNEMLKADISNEDKLATAFDFDEVFGLNLDSLPEKKEIVIPEDLKKLLEERKIARESKNWAKSDEIRSTIAEMGYGVKDTSVGQEIVKIDK